MDSYLFQDNGVIGVKDLPFTMTQLLDLTCGMKLSVKTIRCFPTALEDIAQFKLRERKDTASTTMLPQPLVEEITVNLRLVAAPFGPHQTPSF